MKHIFSLFLLLFVTFFLVSCQSENEPNPVEYTVDFVVYDGYQMDSLTVVEDSLLSEPTEPAREGFEFAGWYKDAEFTQAWQFTTDQVNSNVTLYAKWSMPMINVTFDTDGGSAISPLGFEIESLINVPSKPTKENYTFAGWYKNSEKTEIFDFANDVISEDTTLYAKWKATNDYSQSFKILSIGNSFSEDAHRYLYEIAKSYGIPSENIVIANMYIGGAPLSTHVSNMTSNAFVYEYQLYKRDQFTRTSNISLQQAIAVEDWDVVTFQQVSNNSGLPETYSNYVNQLISFVDQYATNPNVEMMWHMTWAYQQNSSHSGFVNYERDQMTMYQAIVDTIGQKIYPLTQIQKVIPSGTAIQNARTSYIGDLFTRDGYHLSDPLGRYIAGLTFFKTITDFEVSSQTIAYKPQGISDHLQGLSMEAANLAYANRYQVTNSTYTTEPEPEEIEVNGVPYEFSYVQGFWNENATDISPTTDALHNSFAAVMPIPKYMLPVGSEIVLSAGYQYRVIFLEKTGEDTYQVVYRTAMFQIPYQVIDEAFWGSYDYVAFNITTNPTSPINDRLDEVAGKLKLYHPEGTGQGHVDSDLTWSSGYYEVSVPELTISTNHLSSNPLTLGYYKNDTVIDIAEGYKLAYVILTFDMGAYEVIDISPYQTESLYIDEMFSEGKELIAFIVTSVNEDVDLSAISIDSIIDMHPMVVPHVDQEISFISGYWEAGKTAITTTNSNMAFLNGFAASQPQSKHYYEGINSLTVATGYQVRVIFLSYDGYGTYQVVYRTNNLTGTIVFDEVFWENYEYIAFNFSAVPAVDLSSSLDTISSYLSYDMDALSFELGYWNNNASSLTPSTSYAGSRVIPRQFLNSGTILHIEDGYQVRIIFLEYTEENGYKVLNRTENYVGDVVLTNGYYQDSQYIAFNISTAPSTSDLTAQLDTLDGKITTSVFSDALVDHVDAPLSFVSGYWNIYAQSVTTGDTAFIKGFAASNVLSKSSLLDVESIVIAEGYQVRVIFMDYSFNTYTVVVRSDNLTGTILLDDAFWKDYMYISFNISSVPSSDLSEVLDTLPALITFQMLTE